MPAEQPARMEIVPVGATVVTSAFRIGAGAAKYAWRPAHALFL